MDHSRGNAIELIEGSTATVNMTATANPLPIEYEWSKESAALELEKIGGGSSSTVPQQDLDKSEHVLSRYDPDRLSVSGGVLNISKVRREDSGYYTVSATNAEGTTQTKIKIDVLYAPRYVIHLLVTLYIYT